MVSYANCGKFSTCEIMCMWCACGCVVCPAVVRISPCHSRQPSVISDASAADGDRSSTPSDINSPRHRTHSLCNVRAAWPPRPSNHTSTLFPKLLPVSVSPPVCVCPSVLLARRVSACLLSAGADGWWWCYFKL